MERGVGVDGHAARDCAERGVVIDADDAAVDRGAARVGAVSQEKERARARFAQRKAAAHDSADGRRGGRRIDDRRAGERGRAKAHAVAIGPGGGEGLRADAQAAEEDGVGGIHGSRAIHIHGAAAGADGHIAAVADEAAAAAAVVAHLQGAAREVEHAGAERLAGGGRDAAEDLRIQDVKGAGVVGERIAQREKLAAATAAAVAARVVAIEREAAAAGEFSREGEGLRVGGRGVAFQIDVRGSGDRHRPAIDREVAVARPERPAGERDHAGTRQCAPARHDQDARRIDRDRARPERADGGDFERPAANDPIAAQRGLRRRDAERARAGFRERAPRPAHELAGQVDGDAIRRHGIGDGDAAADQADVDGVRLDRVDEAYGRRIGELQRAAIQRETLRAGPEHRVGGDTHFPARDEEAARGRAEEAVERQSAGAALRECARAVEARRAEIGVRPHGRAAGAGGDLPAESLRDGGRFQSRRATQHERPGGAERPRDLRLDRAAGEGARGKGIRAREHERAGVGFRQSQGRRDRPRAANRVGARDIADRHAPDRHAAHWYGDICCTILQKRDDVSRGGGGGRGAVEPVVATGSGEGAIGRSARGMGQVVGQIPAKRGEADVVEREAGVR